ncbi:hypothetical protein DHB74_03450 [Pseudomonas sp. G11-1]|nr:hypothetical protein [Pseudomonas sp. G11-1]MCO5788487.1 hypothetical protein [Pseudomonas sp. G11-2]
MIGILLVATMGLGLLMVISNTLSIQSHGITENQILTGLRNLTMLDDNEIVLGVTGSDGGRQALTVPVQRIAVDSEVVIDIGGISRTMSVPGERLEVHSEEYISGDGRIVVAP